MAKILIVEDQVGIREEVQTWLEFENHEVAVAANGKDGLEKAYQFVPNLILCDVLMPDMNGYELLAQIRASATFQGTRFVFMTARASKEDIEVGSNLGANSYLIKPFTFEEMLNVINTQLK